jgi:hypothetical protein
MLHKFLLAAALICATAISGFAGTPWSSLFSRRVPLVERTIPYYAENPRKIPAAPQAYPYGYFGAQYRPYSVIHKGYYHDVFQWSYRTGY